MQKIVLTKSIPSDINRFYEYQLDEEANYLAAFTAKDPNDKLAYLEKYTKFLTDPTVNMFTIKMGDEIVGTVTKFIMFEQAGVAYWIDKKYWGQGIATTALKDFLQIEKARPIFGHAAFDNYPSHRVLEKCGFVKTGTDKGYANARKAEIEEFIFRLD